MIVRALITLALASPLMAAPGGSFTYFLEDHCLDCHDSATRKGGFDLEALGESKDGYAALKSWTRVYDQIVSGEMPPEDKDQPAEDEERDFLAELGRRLIAADDEQKGTVLRRLNRVEYEQTLNDLLGTRESLAGLLPEDGQAYHFDKVGAALDLSASHLERYLMAAEQAIDAAVNPGPKPETKQGDHDFIKGHEDHFGKHWRQLEGRRAVFFNGGGYPPQDLKSFSAHAEGRYRVRLRGAAFQSEEPVRFELWHGNFGRGGENSRHGVLAFEPGEEQVHEVELYLKERDKLRVIPMLDVDRNALRRGGPDRYPGRGIVFAPLEIEGPVFDEWPGRGHELLFGGIESREIEPANPNVKKRWNYVPRYEFVSERPEADAERLLRGLLPRVFRRPVGEEDLAPLMALVRSRLEVGERFGVAMRAAYAAALCSPDFLFFREAPGELDDFALATRLSYALWNTAPDEELLELAGRGELSEPGILRAQTERLLEDPRSDRFVSQFTGQWLALREIDATTPDAKLYPEYDDWLKESMVLETEAFFREVLREDLSPLEFIDSDWTMVNERLARHYGIEGVRGSAMRKVMLKPEHRRGGVLTHASVLKVSANGANTSPVLRGVFVLERIMGIEPTPPPPGVPGVEPDIRGATTLREQLEKHRDVESCTNCHRLIDPPGFALENYDVMGGWRERYRSLNPQAPKPPKELWNGATRVQWRVGPEVDASGETRGGEEFAGLDEFKRILLSDPEAMVHAQAEKLAVYLSGRGMGFSDRAELERIAQRVVEEQLGYRELLHELVQGPIFRQK